MNTILLRRVLAATALVLFAAGCRAPSPVVHHTLETKAGVPLAPADRVRIGIRVAADEASITSEGKILALEATSGRQEIWAPGKYMFAAKGGVITINDKPRGGAWRLKSQDPATLLQAGTNTYRGTLVVKPAAGDKVTIIDELDIDDYLKGVLPREAVVTWPDQSLRAQAVASRTYLASHLNRHSDQGFDLCSDVHCQVFGGATKEHPRTNEAVDATRGQILTYDGKPVTAYFSADCGGHTERVGAVWGLTDVPYLPSQRCDWDRSAPWFLWKNTFTNEYILASLKAKNLVKGTQLRSLSVTKKSTSRRAERMSVRTDAGLYTMSGNDFRIALNPEKIRSTLFTSVERLKGGYVFAGKGWGHGIGMCQFGAKGLAEIGKDYREILSYYYPGTELSVWSRK